VDGNDRHPPTGEVGGTAGNRWSPGEADDDSEVGMIPVDAFHSRRPWAPRRSSSLQRPVRLRSEGASVREGSSRSGPTSLVRVADRLFRLLSPAEPVDAQGAAAGCRGRASGWAVLAANVLAGSRSPAGINGRQGFESSHGQESS